MEDPTIPSTLIYNLEVRPDQIVAISLGWCTTTEEILEENLKHMQWLLEADGELIEMEALYRSKFVDQGAACEGYDGLIMKWGLGEHTITRTLIIDQDINDGWGTYVAGEYVEIFIVNVIR